MLERNDDEIPRINASSLVIPLLHSGLSNCDALQVLLRFYIQITTFVIPFFPWSP